MAAQAGALSGDVGTSINSHRNSADENYQQSHTASIDEVAENALVNLTTYELVGSEIGDPLMCRWLESHSVDALACMNLAGPIVRTPGNVFADFFEFDRMGTVCLAMAVHGSDAETVVDIVGWEARAPEFFATIYARAGLLGLDQLLNPATYHAGKPCPIWRTPMRWLQEGCHGVVVLNRELGRLLLSRASGCLAAEDVDHARDIHNRGLVDASRLMVPNGEGGAP